MIRWKLGSLMADRLVKGIDLARELNLSANSISSLRRAVSMPRIDGEQLERMMKAIEKITGKPVLLSDLVEIENG